MKVAILGFGREGKSLLKYLWRRGTTPHQSKLGAGQARTDTRISADENEIWVLDRNPSIKVPRGVRAQLGKNYLKNLKRFDLLFRSPGVPYILPELVRARKQEVAFSSATKLFFERCPAQIIGVTGTKGKGTTATLLYKILKAHSIHSTIAQGSEQRRTTSSGQAALRRVFLAGNIGKPALDLSPKLTENDWVVLELSSFQLQDLTASPHIAVVLDVFPDHQDAHKTLREYYEAKANVARYQKRGDTVFFFKDNALSRRIASKSVGKKIGVDEKKFRLFRPEELALRGVHNFRNASMAATVARHLGVPARIILKTAKNFGGLEHRLEFARSLALPAQLPIRRKRYSNVFKNIRITFWNDSASTNPHTAAAAVKAFSPKSGELKAESSIILISGGSDKGLDYAPLAHALKGSSTTLAILFGENKKKIQRAIKGAGVPIRLAPNLESAVKLAYRASRFYILDSKFSIIFSPGAASFDQFQNYADRGKQFKKIVQRLTENRK